MKPVWLGVLCFGLGMVLQLVRMLHGRSRHRDARRAWLAVLISLLGFVPGRYDYRILEHVFYCYTVFAFAFAISFRQRLLPKVGGRLLLAWNILLIYVALRAGWGSPALLLIAIPTIATIVNAFSDIDRAFGWRVFFLAWFAVILVAISVSGFDAGLLDVFLEANGLGTVRPWLLMLAAGAAYFYIIANACFVLALVPVKIRRGQTWRERMEEIHRHMELLARGYVWEKEDPLGGLVVLVCLPLVLIAEGIFGPENGRYAVPVAIAAMPILLTRGASIADEPWPQRGKDYGPSGT